MADIAARAGVSRMAVSAVLMGTGSGRIRVAEQTAARIRQIAEEMGYRPNLAARQLAGLGSGTLALVAHDWGNFLTQRALAWLHAAAEQHGLRVLAVYSRQSTEPIERLLRDLRAGWVDGVVYLAHENESQWPQVAQLFQGIRNAIVAMGDFHVSGVASVVSDVGSGAKACVDHLVGRGCHHPVFVTEELESRAMRLRWAAYQEAAQSHGLAFDEQQLVIETKGWLAGSPDDYARFDDLAHHLITQHRADAVLCDTDFTAVGLLRALRRLGRRVPEDISVIGWGDLQFAELFDPPITTVSLNLPDLLARVVGRLLRSNLEPGNDVESVPTTLIVRESA